MIWNNREIILLLIIIENKKKNQRERENQIDLFGFLGSCCFGCLAC